MSRKIFVNLPVKDLKRSMEFFTALDFRFDERFTDTNAACMIIGDDIFAMLLVEGFFSNFTKKEISDARKSSEVIIAITAGSKAEVDELMSKALSAGAREYREAQEMEGMYGRSFEDPDGHQWEIFHMILDQG